MEVDSQEYAKHYRTLHPKTFYFFCKRLSSQPENIALSSTDLNEHILSELKQSGIEVHPASNPRGWFGVEVNPKFNAHGWFGQAWTGEHDPSRNERFFRREYEEVLLRIGEEPYHYQVKPEYFDLLKEIFAELERNA
jgi:hypothetical protein